MSKSQFRDTVSMTLLSLDANLHTHREVLETIGLGSRSFISTDNSGKVNFSHGRVSDHHLERAADAFPCLSQRHWDEILELAVAQRIATLRLKARIESLAESFPRYPQKGGL